MQNEKFTIEEILALPDLITLREHIRSNTSGLVGCQWVVVELFRLFRGPAVKILGSGDEDQMCSAPLTYFKLRQFCGIHYHMQDWCTKPTTIESIQELSTKHGNQFAFYNPYQDKVILV